ncbi:hypothetical protein [Streptomyces sp. NPDC088554]|uniref:hypothetical protein n=1 Tax=Streptomyces sp. NPDC088554 TaxID=3365865 RepID=UPI003813ABFA
MSERKFLDCDGDTWTEYEPGWLRLTDRANGVIRHLGCVASVEDVRDDHGPLTEIRPDVRALLADVLEEMADSAHRSHLCADDDTDSAINYRIYDLFSTKARELRKESA